MESNWRMNVATFGWADYGIDLYARYINGGVEDPLKLVRITGTKDFWFVFVRDSVEPIALEFNSGPWTFEYVKQFPGLEPD